VIHLRIVAPAPLAQQVVTQLMESPVVTDVVHVPGAVRKPDADLILCDVAREETTGAMVVGPEFGPLAGICVALVTRQLALAKRSFVALAVGFPAATAAAAIGTGFFRWTGIGPEQLPAHPLTVFISHLDFFSFIVAFLAGTAGILSLTSAKSGALIGVLISVTTIPAAANIGVAAVYGDWNQVQGASLQLVVNLTAIILGGVARMSAQRRVWLIRQRQHKRRLGRATTLES
jgi:uncharacterized hydrophobic protein (TIGR00271 family)